MMQQSLTKSCCRLKSHRTMANAQRRCRVDALVPVQQLLMKSHLSLLYTHWPYMSLSLVCITCCATFLKKSSQIAHKCICKKVLEHTNKMLEWRCAKQHKEEEEEGGGKRDKRQQRDGSDGVVHSSIEEVTSFLLSLLSIICLFLISLVSLVTQLLDHPHYQLPLSLLLGLDCP